MDGGRKHDAEDNSTMMDKTTPLREADKGSTSKPSDGGRKHDAEDNSTMMDETTPLREADRGRLEAAEKKRKRQHASAAKMKKDRAKHNVESGTHVGAVVTIQNDYRDCPHPQGLRGIVVQTRETGGVLVCCEYGMVSTGARKKEYWIPSDRYIMTQTKDEDAVLSVKLEQIRNEILSGSFSKSDKDKICLSSAHAFLVGSKTKKPCRCPKGCNWRCSCIKEKVACSSSCGCNGLCVTNIYNNM